MAQKNTDASAAASAMGKLGGAARAKSLSKEQRQEIAKKGAQTRWGKRNRMKILARKGAAARNKTMTAEQRKESAAAAARARWNKTATKEEMPNA